MDTYLKYLNKEDVAIMHEAYRMMPPRHSPIQVEKQQGRNEKCKCNSGKKYKRCCGA